MKLTNTDNKTILVVNNIGLVRVSGWKFGDGYSEEVFTWMFAGHTCEETSPLANIVVESDTTNWRVTFGAHSSRRGSS